MAITCPNCKSNIQPEAPFCPGCGAPQIRVSPHAPEKEEETREDEERLPEAPAPGPPPIDWNHARSRSMMAAAIMVMLLLIPFGGLLFFIWLPVGGGLAVYFYKRSRPQTIIPAGAGARMGLVAGLFAFAAVVAIFALEMLFEFYVMHQGSEFVGDLRAHMQQAVNTGGNPQAQQMMQSLLTPNGLAALVVLAMVFMLVAFLLLSALGGALGAGWTERKRH